MSLAHNLPQNLRALLRQPRTHKKRRPRFRMSQQLQRRKRALLIPRFETPPALLLDHAEECRRMEVVFEGDRQYVRLGHRGLRKRIANAKHSRSGWTPQPVPKSKR